MKSIYRIELNEARVMVQAAIREAAAIGVAQTVCVVDEGGFPVAMERMDGARITGPQIAWNKAFTAAGHKRSTHLFNQAPGGAALPGNGPAPRSPAARTAGQEVRRGVGGA